MKKIIQSCRLIIPPKTSVPYKIPNVRKSFKKKFPNIWKGLEQEESYTSKASFWDKDVIPVYNADNPQKYHFSGKRMKRGLYRTANGKLLNADLNGALNILRKSSVVDLTVLYSSGEVDTPVRIRVA